MPDSDLDGFDENELFGRAGIGPNAIFEELCHAYRSRLIRVATRLGVVASTAEDIVQTALLRFWIQLAGGKFVRTVSVLGFLRTTVENLVRDHFRRAKVRKAEPLDDPAQPRHISCQGPGPQTLVIRKQLTVVALGHTFSCAAYAHEQLVFILIFWGNAPRVLVRDKSNHSLFRLSIDVKLGLESIGDEASVSAILERFRTRMSDSRVDSIWDKFPRLNTNKPECTLAMSLLRQYYLTKKPNEEMAQWCSRVKRMLIRLVAGERSNRAGA